MNQFALLENKIVEEKILLHGSARKLFDLRPNKRINDGPSALCATQFPEIAILMAILRGCKGKGGVKYKNIITQENPVLHLRLSPVKLESLLTTDEIKGYVYLLDRDGFDCHTLNEFRTKRSRFVREPITVSKSDLPFIPKEGEREYYIPLSMNIVTSFPVRDYFL